MKRLTSLAVVIVATAGLVSPVTASAQWTDKGLPLTQNATVPITGSLHFNSSAGGIACLFGVTATATLNSGTTGGTLDNLAPSLPLCALTGGFAAICASLTAVHTQPYNLDAAGAVGLVTSFHIIITLTGGFLCPKTITMAGALAMTPLGRFGEANRAAIHSLEFEGEVAGSVAGPYKVFGQFHMKHASDTGTYGF